MNIDQLEALLSGKRLEPLIVGHIYDPKLMCVVRAANTDAILLSPDTIVKQRRLHPDIGLDEYYLLPDVIRYGMVAQEHAEQLIFCYHHHTDRRFLLVVEATIQGMLFAIAFRRTTPRQTESILEGALLLRNHA